ncbi:SPOSA6832_04586, partial [Sporobolomyces salmonicolor]
MSNDHKIVIVFGATGSQGEPRPARSVSPSTHLSQLAGGSVVKYLLEHPEFSIRAVTRNPDSASAQALQAQGVELVKGDAADQEACLRVCEGAWGVFGLTDFWAVYYSNGLDDQGAYEVEVQHGRNMVDAVKAKGVRVFVYSTLNHTHTGAPHWEAKHVVNEYAKKAGVPLISLYTSCYYENATKFNARNSTRPGSLRCMLQQGDNGELFLDFQIASEIPFMCFSVNEVGGWVAAAFRNPDRWLGKDMHAVGEYVSLTEMGKILTRVLGRKVHTPTRTVEEFHSDEFKNRMDPELWRNMAIFVDDDTPNTPHQLRDAQLSKAAFPGASTFEHWAAHDEGLQKAVDASA